MKTGKLTGYFLLFVLTIIVTGVPHAQIVESGNFIMNSDGTGSVSIKFDTPVEEVAGFQGKLLYDPSRISGISLSMSPTQPDSFVVCSHLANPGELNFVIYSPTDVLNLLSDILVCSATVDTDVQDKGFDSVLVLDLDMFATTDTDIQPATDAYINIPMNMPAQTATERDWLMYF